MRITALDITQKTFRRVLRGVDPEEVAAFLGLCASEIEGLSRQLQVLREDAIKKDEQIAELRGRERVLQETMVSAQQAAENIREAARKGAEITLSEAELQAEKIVQSAHQRYLRVVDDLAELKRQRAQFTAGLRSMIEAHQRLMEALLEPREAAPEPARPEG